MTNVFVENITTQVEIEAGYDLFEVVIEDFDQAEIRRYAEEAAESAAEALASEEAAADSADAASASQIAAAGSATSASNSANSATASASTATTQAGIATTQAGIATTQAGIATTKANEAAASAAAALASETDAETAASTATTQAGIANTQAGIATTKADEASTSAANALASANTAATQAGIATTQAGNALTSANNAAASAVAAANSASQAAQVGTSTTLLGYTVGANTAIVAADSILQAFQKTQGQINARVSGTIATGQVAFGTAANTVGGDADFTYNSTTNLLTLGGGVTLTGAQTIQTSTGALTLQPLGGSTTGINLTNNVNIYSGSNTGVIRNTVTNGLLQIVGGNTTADGGNISLGGSTGTNQVQVRIGNTNHSVFAPSGNLLVGATSDGGARLQVQGTANFVTGVGIGAASAGNYINTGPILTTTLTNGGSGYVDGTYVDVAASSVATTFGVSALFTIVVSGGIVTTATITWGGTAYRVGDTLTVANTLLGGTGSGLVITVNTVESSQLTITGSNGGDITLYRNDTSIATGDNLGTIKWENRDSSAKASGFSAEIGAFAVGAGGAAQLSFFTSNGSGSALTEGFRLTNLSNLLIGSTTDSGQRLQVTGTTFLNGLSTIQGTTASDTAPLGSELATTGTGTNWTGTDFATGYTHTIGSTAALTTTLAAVVSTFYQITYTVTGRTTGSFVINYGGTSSPALTATGAFGPRATSTATLEIVPTTDFNGTIVLSVRTISISSASVTFNNSAGTATNQIRINSSITNTFIGSNAGRTTTTGLNNTFLGSSTGANNTTGANNSFFGTSSGRDNTTGANNSFFGTSSGVLNTSGTLNSFFGASSGTANTTGGSNSFFGQASGQANTTGSDNSFFGRVSGQANTIGESNSFFGVNSGFSNTTGIQNSLFGTSSGLNNISGSRNTFIGVNAARYTGSGTTAMTSISNSIYLGYQTRGLNATGSTNEIVIGYDVVGLGSNTTVLGNSSTTFGRWFGNLLLGTSTNGGSPLRVVGLPTSATGLSAGDVWSDGGTLKIA